jgi:hypothetical protein
MYPNARQQRSNTAAVLLKHGRQNVHWLDKLMIFAYGHTLRIG